FMLLFLFFLIGRPLPRSTLFPYTTLFRSRPQRREWRRRSGPGCRRTRLRSSADSIGRRSERHTNNPRPGWVGGKSVWLRCGQHRSEEHTSELQSRFDLVCRLLLEKKKKTS